MTGSGDPVIRRYRPEDAAGLAGVFHDAVQGTGPTYSSAQRNEWSPAPNPEMFWDREADGRRVWVAEQAGVITGFIELEPDGHIDCFYCHPRGAGAALFARVEAETNGPLFTEASDVARPFFAARGFEVVAEQEVERNGVILQNTRMVKRP